MAFEKWQIFSKHMSLDKLNSDMAAERLRGACESFKSYSAMRGIQQPIQLAPACFHLPRHL